MRFVSEERRIDLCNNCAGLNQYYCSRDIFGVTNCYLLRNPEQTTLKDYEMPCNNEENK